MVKVNKRLLPVTAEALDRYFKTLTQYGYKSYSEVYKLLTLILVEELVDNDFRGFLTEKDYITVNGALSCLYGSSCLIPWLDFCNGGMNIDYKGSMSELAYRVAQLEKNSNELQKTLEDAEVVVPGDEIKQVADIQV